MDILFLIGLSLILGYIGGKLTKRFKFPSVVGYLIVGVLLGPSVFKIFDLELLKNLDLITDLALALVAFTIGSELRSGVLKRQGLGIFTIILAESLGAFFMVAFLVYILTHKLYLALIFGAIAPASAPAGTVVVLQEYKAKGPLTNTLLSVVGLDDGLAIVIYGFAAALAKVLLTKSDILSINEVILAPLIEIGGAVILGASVGACLVYFARKIRSKSDTLIVFLGAILVCAGLSNLFNVSLILSNLTLGMVMANMFIHTSRRTFNVIQNITPPIYVAFFVLAGAHLQIGLLSKMGLLGLFYLTGRSSGLMGGAYLGALITKAEDNIRKYLGLGILSQAGVAIGLALLAVKEFSSLGVAGKNVASLVINTVAATTIIFEIIGPITTKIAITKSGEAGKLKQ